MLDRVCCRDHRDVHEHVSRGQRSFSFSVKMREWMHVLLLAKARSLLNVDSRAALQWAEVKGQPTTSELIRQDAVPQPLATVADSYNGDFEWAAGYCDTTAELVLSSTKGGDCLRGSKGSIKLPPSAAVSLRAAMGFCSAYCERCKRCAYASVSAQWSDCSWFSSCSLDALRHDVQHFWSARIRPAPLVGSTLPSIGKAQRIAVCLAGHPRTFARRHVYTSIGEHLVGGLRAHGAKVDLFALLKTGDAPVKKQGGWNFSQVEDNSDATWAALAVLKPRAVLRLHRNHLPPHQRCLDGKRGGMGMGSLGLDRSTVQPALYATCFDIVTKAEALDGAQYDWIVRSRPDAWWYAPHPPLCETAPGAKCSAMAHGTHGSYLDQHFALPRIIAHVLRDLADQYMACNGKNTTWEFVSIEHWLLANLNAATQAVDLPPPLRVSFPFVLVRKSASEPSAKVLCRMQSRSLHGASFKVRKTWADACTEAQRGIHITRSPRAQARVRQGAIENGSQTWV
jgi:hypothetical protein